MAPEGCFPPLVRMFESLSYLQPGAVEVVGEQAEAGEPMEERALEQPLLRDGVAQALHHLGKRTSARNGRYECA